MQQATSNKQQATSNKRQVGISLSALNSNRAKSFKFNQLKLLQIQNKQNSQTKTNFTLNLIRNSECVIRNYFLVSNSLLFQRKNNLIRNQICNNYFKYSNNHHGSRTNLQTKTNSAFRIKHYELKLPAGINAIGDFFMKKKTKILMSGLLVLVISVFLLSGCGSKSSKLLKAMDLGDIETIEKIVNSVDAKFFEELTKEKAFPGGDFSYSFNKAKDGVVITGYNGSAKTVIIPAEIEGYPVVEIGERAFDDHRKAVVNHVKNIVELGNREKNHNSIIIPNSVRIINSYAFNHSGIKSIIIPDSVTEIKDSAFFQCDNMKFVKFGNSLKNIGQEAFLGCTELKKINLPDSLKK